MRGSNRVLHAINICEGDVRMQKNYKLLKHVKLFSKVPDADLELIANECKWQQYGPNEEVVGYQEPDNDVYFMISGKARIRIYAASGKVVAFRKLEEGDAFGEFAAIDGGPRSAKIDTVKDALLAKMRASDFQRVVSEQTTVSQALILHLVQQLRALTKRIVDFSTLSVNQRIEAELLKIVLECSNQIAEGAALIASPPTHAELATHISTHREAVSRHLGVLSRENLIKRRPDGALLIHDVEALRDRVCKASGERR